ncbi:MAG: thiol-disulfide oxidoreductase DCC family protein [Ignavibacteria bacterium]|nr:thiol-disulfide oxidoreductase DCC family protein [Ignavibacteria bacterium]
MKEKGIILFDGVCNMCNASVNFIIDRDKANKFKFASLQSETGKNLLVKFQKDAEKLDSVVLITQGKLYDKSSAALKIASMLPFPYPLSILFRVFPKALRDIVYDYIAKNRYKWFGKKDACRIPDAETKSRFL